MERPNKIDFGKTRLVDGGESFRIRHGGLKSYSIAQDVFIDFQQSEIERLKEGKICNWEVYGGEDNFFETSCGNIFEFTDGGPKENKAKYCQYCGGKIEVG